MPVEGAARQGLTLFFDATGRRCANSEASRLGDESPPEW
jgi:hypothetical protein